MKTRHHDGRIRFPDSGRVQRQYPPMSNADEVPLLSARFAFTATNSLASTGYSAPPSLHVAINPGFGLGIQINRASSGYLTKE